MSKYLRDGDGDHGGSGHYNSDGSIHYTNFDSTNNTRTSYDEDSYGNVYNIHSVDQNTKEKTQHDFNRDGDPRKYSE